MATYVIGIDGGGTKTSCILADTGGRTVAKLETGGSNHQLCGIDRTAALLEDAVNRLPAAAGLCPADIGFICMGLAGVDFDSDLALLEAHLPKGLKAIPHQILNDIWIAFFAGTESSFGAVSICGTGHNTGVICPQGRGYGISALRFPLGNFGGGRMLTDFALNAGFRSYEGTGEKTLLEEHLPETCRSTDMGELLLAIYHSNYHGYYDYPIPVLVDALAQKGDAVCRRILAKFGRVQGEMTGRLLQKAEMHALPHVPIVLAGSLYTKQTTTFLTDAFAREVKKYCENPQFHILRRAPVQGAVLNAIRNICPHQSPAEQHSACP